MVPQIGARIPLVVSAAHLSAYVQIDEMCGADPRRPAIALVSPVLLSFLHQHELGGTGVRPLNVNAFLSKHAAAFVRAQAPYSLA